MMRPIASKHLLEDVDIHKTSFNKHPIGSGPFKFQEWTDDDTITLVANKDYFEKGRPFLDKLIFKTFPSQREAFEAVERGEVDITIGLIPDIELVYPLVDALLDEGRTTLDLQKRKEIYHKIHELIASDYPAVFIASPYLLIGSNYRVKWIEQFPHAFDIFNTIKDWQIAKNHE